MSLLYEFHADADKDFRGIIRHTRKTWGATQASIYKAKLTRCIETLTNDSGFNANNYDLRMVLCEHHYIFMLPRLNRRALVLAILHERMDILERVKARL